MKEKVLYISEETIPVVKVDYDGKPFGERTEKVIRKEIQDFEAWLRREIYNHDFYHDYDDGYHPDDDALIEAVKLDTGSDPLDNIFTYENPFEQEIKERNITMKENELYVERSNKPLDENKKREADNFFKGMGILNK